MADSDDVIHAQQRVRLEAEYRAGRRLIQPDRITAAFDIRGLDGPEVDEACGAREPDVDHWEAGMATPTWEQVEKMATLTDLPVEFFFRDPLETRDDSPTFLCGRGGCEVLEPREPVAPFDPAAPVARVYQLPKRRQPTTSGS